MTYVDYLMQEISRRKFMGMAGSVATGLALLVGSLDSSLVTSARAEDPGKTPPLIELLDDRYKFEVVVDGLTSPGNLLVNPSDNHVFFVQRTGTGNGEGVYEIVNGKPEYRFPGAGNSGSLQSTRIAINDKNELVVYSQSGADESIRIADTKTGRQLFELEEPYKDEKYLNEKVSEIAINPKDKRLYIMKRLKGSIDVLDREKRKVMPWIQKGPNSNWFCFDRNGNLYAHDDFVFGREITKEGGLTRFVRISPDKKIEKIRSPKVVESSKDIITPNTEIYWHPHNMLLSDKACFMTGSFFECFDINDVRIKDSFYDPRFKDLFVPLFNLVGFEGKKTSTYESFYSFYPGRNEARPLVRINNRGHSSAGCCLDQHGNLYFSTYLHYGIANQGANSGQIIKVSKK
jgi:hypothetical protein